MDKNQNPPRTVIALERQRDGTLVNWGRLAPHRCGPAQAYFGEAAKIMELVIKHSKGRDENTHTSQP